MVVKYFHIFCNFQKSDNCQSLGLPIICEFEELKWFAQLLVGKSTFAKLHMSKA